MNLPPGGCFALHLLDVGQGEAILLDLPDGTFALIDSGPRGAFDILASCIDARIREGRTFRFAALTHWDLDHIGSFAAVIRRYRPLELVRPAIDFGLVKRLCLRFGERIIPNALEEVDLLEAEISSRPLSARQDIPDVGPGVQIWALAPAKIARNRLAHALSATTTHRMLGALETVRNDISLVLWIRAHGRALLLSGEVNADTAGELREQFGRISGKIHEDPRSVWIKLGHHGSKTSTSSELIRVFTQDNFVASASHGAQHGHPHPRSLSQARDGGRGRMMCNRLGKACLHLRNHPTVANDPTWFEKCTWKDGPPLHEHCYGTVTVTVYPDGACSFSGSLAERTDCPFGGPPDGRIAFGPLV